jgi:hypothetical protein
MMFALGLQEHLVGTAYLDDAILPQFAVGYEKVPSAGAWVAQTPQVRIQENHATSSAVPELLISSWLRAAWSN